MATQTKISQNIAPDLKFKINTPQTQAPVSFFADQVGEINVSPFVSRMVFTNSHAGATGPQTPVISVSMPTPNLFNLAGTIFTVLSKEETNAAFKLQFEGFLNALDDLKKQVESREKK